MCFGQGGGGGITPPRDELDLTTGGQTSYYTARAPFPHYQQIGPATVPLLQTYVNNLPSNHSTELSKAKRWTDRQSGKEEDGGREREEREYGRDKEGA